MKKSGFDVSRYQNAIDWSQITGQDFVFIRAMLGVTPDERFVENLAGARSAGVEASVYHVVHEDIAAERQAAALLEALSAAQLRPRLPIVLDVERPLAAGSTTAHRRTLEHARIITSFLQEAGYRVMIYTAAWWWNPACRGVDVGWATALDLWVATYGMPSPILPTGWHTWRFWQYTSSGRLSGIKGNVDLNVFAGDWDVYLGIASIPTFYLEGATLDLVLGGRVVARIAATEHAAEEPPAQAEAWALPVGTPAYPGLMWGVRGYTHDLRPTAANPNRRNGRPWPHTGYDINLDVAPYGDIERGMPVVAIAGGVVLYVTDDWSGVGMCIVRHAHNGEALYVRYAHIVVQVKVGQAVVAGQVLGLIADYPNEGDHLHFDMARDPFTREWLTPSIRWLDPAPVLKAHIEPALVDDMLRVGD